MAKLGATATNDAICDLYHPKPDQSLTGGAFNNLTFTSAPFATSNGSRGVLRNFSLAADNVTITPNQTGVYLLNARVALSGAVGAVLTVRSNSSNYELASKSAKGDSGVGTHITLSQVVYLTANESFYVQVYVTSAGYTALGTTSTFQHTGITLVKLGRFVPTAASTHIDAAASPYAPDGTRSFSGTAFGTAAQMGGWTSNANVDPLGMTQISGGQYYPGITLPTGGWWWLRTSTNFWGDQAQTSQTWRYGYINANNDLFYNTTTQNTTGTTGNQHYCLCETSAIAPFNAGANIVYGFAGPTISPYYVTSYATSGKTDAQAVYLGPL